MSDVQSRVYRRPMPAAWWTRRAHYFWYIVREFTSLPLAVWLLWFLVEIQRAQNGPKGVDPAKAIQQTKLDTTMRFVLPYGNRE